MVLIYDFISLILLVLESPAKMVSVGISYDLAA